MTIRARDFDVQSLETQPTRRATSAATMGSSIVIEESGASAQAQLRRRWQAPALDTLVFATMLPFASVYEPSRVRLRYEGATSGAYVIVVGQQDDSVYSPDVVVISPKRHTVRISVKPRLLPKREPFFAPSDLLGTD